MTETAEQPALHVQGLRKAFGGRTAVDGIDLSVARGEVFGLVGPDGAGKTTTFRLLCGILRPDAGQVLVAGHDVQADPEAVKRRIGYLSQAFGQYQDLTVWENLRFTADLYTVPEGEWQQRAEELLQASRMAPFKDRLAGNLSGGMKQKLALSCTLLHTPEVVFLDEPTTGVDPVSRRDFWSILYDLPRQGVTIVVSTPYMDEAEHCRRLTFMSQGRLLPGGTPRELKEAMGAEVLQLFTDRPREAREALRARADVSACILLGDRLHVLTAAGADGPAAVRSALERQGIAITALETVEPGLDDVFAHLARQAGNAGAATEGT